MCPKVYLILLYKFLPRREWQQITNIIPPLDECADIDKQSIYTQQILQFAALQHATTTCFWNNSAIACSCNWFFDFYSWTVHIAIAPEIKFQIFLALVLVISALCLNIAKSGSKDESQAKLQRTKRCEANERRMGSANMKFSQ